MLTSCTFTNRTIFRLWVQSQRTDNSQPRLNLIIEKTVSLGQRCPCPHLHNVAIIGW